MFVLSACARACASLYALCLCSRLCLCLCFVLRDVLFARNKHIFLAVANWTTDYPPISTVSGFSYLQQLQLMCEVATLLGKTADVQYYESVLNVSVKVNVPRWYILTDVSNRIVRRLDMHTYAFLVQIKAKRSHKKLFSFFPHEIYLFFSSCRRMKPRIISPRRTAGAARRRKTFFRSRSALGEAYSSCSSFYHYPQNLIVPRNTFDAFE